MSVKDTNEKLKICSIHLKEVGMEISSNKDKYDEDKIKYISPHISKVRYKWATTIKRQCHSWPQKSSVNYILFTKNKNKKHFKS